MLARLSFKSKLLALCAFLVAVSITVGAIGYFGQNQVSTEYEHVTHVTVPKTELVYQMLQHYRQVRIALRTLGLQGISPAEAETAVRETVEAIDKYEDANKKYVEMGFTPGQKEVYEKLQAAWVDFKAVGGRVLELHKSGKSEDQAKIMDIFFHDCPEKAKAYAILGDSLLKFHKESEEAWILEAQSTAQHTNVISLFAILIGSVIGMGVGIYFATTTANRLSGIISRLAADSQTLATASNQISAASQELSQAATEQAASLEETAASVEEMNSMVTKTSENAKNTSATSSNSEEKAMEGKQVIEQMLGSMSEINQSNAAIMEQINQSNQKMGEIVNVIHGIGEKTKVINDIVFQTKLLSFNASVEAARAGEHGKGFAVVAEEVGNLAAMSGNAAKEITGMLDSSMEKVKNIVAETKEKVEILAANGKAKVESGSGIVRQCADVFEEIVKSVGGVSVMANEISQAAQEQARGIQEITKAMHQLDQVTQQNSSTSQQTATAANQVATQAASLKAAVGELTVTFQGGDPANKTHAQVISMGEKSSRQRFAA